MQHCAGPIAANSARAATTADRTATFVTWQPHLSDTVMIRTSEHLCNASLSWAGVTVYAGSCGFCQELLCVMSGYVM